MGARLIVENYQLDEDVAQVVLPPGVRRGRGPGEVVRLHALDGGPHGGVQLAQRPPAGQGQSS